MLSTTALFTEYLVIGFSAWLWLIAIIPSLGRVDLVTVFKWFAEGKTLGLGLVVILTYTIGVLTESLSFALEKALVGRTSQPRRWYKRFFDELDENEWLQAQRQIWSSDGAFHEFIYNRVRITISRGIATNCILSVMATSLTLLATNRVSRPGLLIFTSTTLFVLSLISWWWATAEYRARVRIAGRIGRIEQP